MTFYIRILTNIFILKYTFLYMYCMNYVKQEIFSISCATSKNKNVLLKFCVHLLITNMNNFIWGDIQKMKFFFLVTLINIDAFDHYYTETARLYVSLYPWFYMPSSVHKILLHGADINT